MPLFGALITAVGHGPQFIGSPIAMFCALYALAVWTPSRTFAVCFPLVIAGFVATSAGPNADLRGSVPFAIIVAVVMLLVRRIVGDRERRAQIAERERDVAAREAVVEERARIARELHDVIAHHVSMIVCRPAPNGACSASERLDARGAANRRADRAQRAHRDAPAARHARGDANEPLTPQPGLADLSTLVGQLREAGLHVELQVDGEKRELPVGIELSAYRIVQEALTNALKHAGDAHATVHVRYGADSLELEVADDGARPGAVRTGRGHGLVGMRERVALYGGRFDAGHNPAGGFVVRAKLPVA